jgi:branched-chain amino acid transport system substrate-binding protein
VLVASARALNRAGGLHGHPLAVVVCNDKTDPNLSVACARQFVDQGVVAVVGGSCLNDALTAPILQAANIPMVAAIPLSNQAYNSPDVFVPQMPTLVSYKLLALYGHFKGLEPQAAVGSDTSAGHSLLQDTGNTLQQVGSGFVGGPIFLNQSTTTDYTPFAVTIDQRRAQSVLLAITARSILQLMTSLVSDGTSVKAAFIAPATSLSQIASIGAAGNKLVTVQSSPPLSDPRMSTLLKAIKAEEARGDLNVDPNTINDSDYAPWIGLQTLIKITKGMKDITGANIIAALQKSGPIKVAPFLTWNPQNHVDPNFRAITNQAGYFIGYNNGHQVLLIKHPVSLADATAGKF